MLSSSFPYLLMSCLGELNMECVSIFWLYMYVVRKCLVLLKNEILVYWIFLNASDFGTGIG